MTTQISAVSSGKKALKPARELIPATLPDLAYTAGNRARNRASVREGGKHHHPGHRVAGARPVCQGINELKQGRNAVMLAHNYMTPDIYHGVADLNGDSLALAREAEPRPTPT